MLKQSVEGVLVRVTPMYYVTADDQGKQFWNRNYYRLSQEYEPQTSPATSAEEEKRATEYLQVISEEEGKGKPERKTIKR